MKLKKLSNCKCAVKVHIDTCSTCGKRIVEEEKRFKEVKIIVYQGVATIVSCPPGVIVNIIDKDES